MYGAIPGVDVVGQSPSPRVGRDLRRFGRERGAFAVMTVFLILVILSFCGLALDLGRMYNRKVELQTAADTIAFAAAARLNGTSEGVNDARDAAEQAAGSIAFEYTTSNLEWSEDAIRFGPAPNGEIWLDAESAALPSNAGSLFFVRVDTSRLDRRHGDVLLLLIRLFTSVGTTAHVSSVATAGRTSIDLMPLAICAMSDVRAAARGTELVEYGFRRGISYNLMKLNPNDSSSAANYLVNPVALSAETATSVMDKMDIIRPFVCTGTLAVPTQAGGKIIVEPDFPLGSLFEQINSRFGTYTEPCISATAPPDSNVKHFRYSTGFPWMNSPPTEQSAESRTYNNRLLTVADLPPEAVPNTTTGGMYGPLWVYARPVVKDARYVEGAVEPTSGYTRFAATSWPTLYLPANAQRVKTGQTYPSTPYTSQVETITGVRAVANRRVLKIPLLHCPVPAGSPASADVLAIGNFFMTIPATSDQLYAEFAGLAHHTSIGGEVKLYP